MFDVLSYYLDNGLKVVLHREPRSRVVKAGIIVNQGSMYEHDEISGISHFIEHMLISENIYNPDIKTLLAELSLYGASYNATTYKANTMFYVNGLSEGLSTYLKLLRTIVFNNEKFSEDILNKEKKIVERELVSYYSSFNQISDRAVQALYGEKSIGRIVIGKRECIESFTLDDIEKIISSTYTPENAAIAIYGDIDYYEVIQMIEDMFTRLEDRKTYKCQEAVQISPNIYFNPNYKGEHGVASVCFRRIQNDNTDYLSNVITLMMSSLCDPSLSNRIGYKLRKESGLAYNIGGFNSAIKQYYSAGINVVFKVEHVADVLKTIVEELDLIRDTGMNEDELKKIKMNVIAKKLYSKGDMSTQAEQLLKLALNSNVYSPENEIRAIEKINIDEINSTMKELLHPNNIGLACIGKCDINDVTKIFDI